MKTKKQKSDLEQVFELVRIHTDIFKKLTKQIEELGTRIERLEYAEKDRRKWEAEQSEYC